MSSNLIFINHNFIYWNFRETALADVFRLVAVVEEAACRPDPLLFIKKWTSNDSERHKTELRLKELTNNNNSSSSSPVVAQCLND